MQIDKPLYCITLETCKAVRTLSKSTNLMVKFQLLSGAVKLKLVMLNCKICRTSDNHYFYDYFFLLIVFLISRECNFLFILPIIIHFIKRTEPGIITF